MAPKKAAADERNVCLLMPVYRSVNPLTHYAIMGVWDRRTMRYQQRAGDAMITRSRNHLARRFLRDTKSEWSVWIDDDIVFPMGNGQWFNAVTGMRLPEAFASLNAIERLTGWGKTVVGSIYYDRWGKGTITAGFDQGIMNAIPSNHLHPAKFCGTGLTAVHRSVYEDVAKKFPETFNPKAPGDECGFFTNIQTKDGRMMGEDESFGWRATQAGHPAYLDLGIVCGHVGDKVYGLP